ncbi:hypothetical protein EVAR_48512_1 [Eumeta japonica]|uniref:Uncharacterized protein n=1 Tax=Eumeta variegata TaxID=151549 RepID=A0A4C1Z1M4_EUMVA|nr:hypothetical protein EVAR_48512_1 [Eumeta japonica]
MKYRSDAIAESLNPPRHTDGGRGLLKGVVIDTAMMAGTDDLTRSQRHVVVFLALQGCVCAQDAPLATRSHVCCTTIKMSHPSSVHLNPDALMLFHFHFVYTLLPFSRHCRREKGCPKSRRP